MKMLKNDFVSSAVNTLMNTQPVVNSPIYSIKERIIKKWVSSAVKSRNSVASSSSTSRNVRGKSSKPFVFNKISNSRKPKVKGMKGSVILPYGSSSFEDLNSSSVGLGATTYTIVDPIQCGIMLVTEEKQNLDNFSNFQNSSYISWSMGDEVNVSGTDATPKLENDWEKLNQDTKTYPGPLYQIENNSEERPLEIVDMQLDKLYHVHNEFRNSPGTKRKKVHNSSDQITVSPSNLIFREKQPKKDKPSNKPKLPPHFCDGCGRVFGKWDTLRCHKKVCDKFENDRKRICSLCSENFESGTWEDLKFHFDQKHPNTQVEKCTMCRSDFLPNTLKSHSCSFKLVNYSNLQSNFKCEICEKKYITRSDLIDHIRRYHKDAKKWTCTFCNKKYSTKTLLDDHEVNHKKPNAKFLCSVCNASCCTRFGLRQHKRIHTGELPYPCNVCEKRFRARSVLKNHMVTHTKERNHECDVCGMKFALHGTMTRHWKRHQLPDTDYTKKCPICLGWPSAHGPIYNIYTIGKPFQI